MILAYILQNWALILITVAFLISLKVTGHQDKWSGKRMYFLVGGVFILSIVVFAEFYLADKGGFLTLRTVLMAVRYSATPLIVAMIIYTLKKKMRWNIFVPALMLAVINLFRSLQASYSVLRRMGRFSADRLDIFRISLQGCTVSV